MGSCTEGRTGNRRLCGIVAQDFYRFFFQLIKLRFYTKVYFLNLKITFIVLFLIFEIPNNR